MMACLRRWWEACANIDPTSIVETFDPRERAEEKRRSREADAAALASGGKTREQLRKENSAFAFPRSRVRLDIKGKKF